MLCLKEDNLSIKESICYPQHLLSAEQCSAYSLYINPPNLRAQSPCDCSADFTLLSHADKETEVQNKSIR